MGYFFPVLSNISIFPGWTDVVSNACWERKKKKEKKKVPLARRGSRREEDVRRVTRKLRRPPISRAIRHRDNHHPHLILGCPVVMFFNYVSLFNVATAHPYLVNRCNFSRRAEMQPVHPGIKGQDGASPGTRARARTHTHTHPHARTHAQRQRDLHLFLYSSGYIGNLSHNREIFSVPSNFQGKMAIYPLKVRYFIFDYTITPENMRHIYYWKNGPGRRTRDWNLLQQLCVKCKERFWKGPAVN